MNTERLKQLHVLLGDYEEWTARRTSPPLFDCRQAENAKVVQQDIEKYVDGSKF